MELVDAAESHDVITFNVVLQSLYSQFIGATSHTPIMTTPTISTSVLDRLWPAFDDLFDEAEEHALGVMLEQWRELRALDQQIFSKVPWAIVNNLVKAHIVHELCIFYTLIIEEFQNRCANKG